MVGLKFEIRNRHEIIIKTLGAKLFHLRGDNRGDRGREVGDQILAYNVRILGVALTGAGTVTLFRRRSS